MAIGYVVVSVIAAAVVVFAFQNGDQVAIRFLRWELPSASVAGLALVALAAGAIVTGVPLWLQRWRLRHRVRGLEAQVRQLETSLRERDRALLRPPSSGGR